MPLNSRRKCLRRGLLVLAALGAASAQAQAPNRHHGPIAAIPWTRHTASASSCCSWPDGTPGAVGSEAQDKPKISVYRAPAGKANGAAVLVCPGGGYRNLASDHEGKQVAEWFNGLGVSAFVLQYRVGPRYHHPAPIAGRPTRPALAALTRRGVRDRSSPTGHPRFLGRWSSGVQRRHAFRRGAARRGLCPRGPELAPRTS